MGWGDGWSNLANQSFGLATNIVAGKLSEKAEEKRLIAAEKALAAREEARRIYEEEVRQKAVVKTYEDPDGNVSQVTQGQIERGEARVPQSIVEQRRQEREAAEQERLRKQQIEDNEERRAEKRVGFEEERIGISREGLGLARQAQARSAAADQTKNFGAGGPSEAEVRQARTFAENRMKEDMKPDAVYAEIASVYGDAIARKAMQGLAPTGAGGGLFGGSVMTTGDSILDGLLNKYAPSN